MDEKLTIEEIELLQLALECLYSELPEYDSVYNKLTIMKEAAYKANKSTENVYDYQRSDPSGC